MEPTSTHSTSSNNESLRKTQSNSRIIKDSNSVLNRLKSELKQLMFSQPPGVSAFPDSDNLFSWVGSITGPEGTIYEGLTYKIIMKFPSDYPFSAPCVQFQTRCYHPNIDEIGNICLDILKDNWSAIYNVTSILVSLQSLLGEPNIDSPLNNEAAELWAKPEGNKYSLDYFPFRVNNPFCKLLTSVALRLRQAFHSLGSVVTHPRSHIRQLWSSVFGQYQKNSKDMSQPNTDHIPSSSSPTHHWITDDEDEDQKGSCTTPSKNTAKRYATYELNWQDNNSSDYFDCDSNDDIPDHNINSQNNGTPVDDSVQPARCSSPNTSPLTIPSPSASQEPSQQNDQPRSTSSHSESSIPPISPINTMSRPESRVSTDNEPQSPFGGITVTTVKVMNQPSIHVPVIHEHKQNINKFSPPQTPQHQPPLPQSRVKDFSTEDSKMLKQKKRSSMIRSQKSRGGKGKSFNTNSKQPAIMIPNEQSFIDPRLLAQRSPFRSPSKTNRRQVKKGGNVNKKKMSQKNMEFAPTSNPVHSNDPTDMEADLLPVKNQTYPWLPGSSKPPQLLHASLVPLPRRVDLRKRESIIVPNPNRASLVFRRHILEESLMMSFGGMVGNVNSKPQPPQISRPIIKRKTKKCSNAKVEDREARRERRRKEKLEKRFAEEASNNSNNVNVQIEGVKLENKNGDEIVTKTLEQNRIIEYQELAEKVEMRKKENQSSPSKSSQDTTMSDYFSQRRSKDDVSSSPPERKKDDDSPHCEPPINKPPHLVARSNSLEHILSKEMSKRKQPPYSPPNSPPSPVSRTPRPIPLEESESDSFQPLPSPVLTSNKYQKVGINILGGIFNKQTVRDATSPPVSQMSSPVLHQMPSPLSPRSPSAPIPLILPLRSPINNPPQSPPLSPSRTSRFPQQLPRIVRPRRGVENDPSSPPAIPDPEKLRKMERFEALIANSEMSSSKKPITGKIKALISNTSTVVTTAASSSSITNSNPSIGVPLNSNFLGRSSETNSESQKENRQKDLARNSSSTNSVAGSVHYRPEEKAKLGKPSQVDVDGVIRVTLTPAVCR
ncbi:15967_t:CDS:10 [Funneliformis mosseae]|uniref:15967_t:CDS:1 n=1 Tax=Funneliformis mosseae TaxID=27381 RepID=A0A9N8ZG97_FUNMO|nr:15967_t:CDS:10 [Funneliformis mosseae]